MDNTLITIIVPIYNVENFLSKCIDSILEQTYQNFELILVDDGSTDSSGKICDEYATKDNRIKVIHKKNAGVNEARITGFKESHGEYVTFVDSDDYVSPLYVECLYRPIAEKGVDVSCVQWIIVKSEYLKKDKRTREGFFDKSGIKDILKTDFLFNYCANTTAYNLGLCCKLIKREFLDGAMEKARGLWLGEDLVANLYIAYRISSLFILNEYPYYYVQHESQSTRSGLIKSWENLVEQWNRILSIDEKHYLSRQLPYRILQFTKIYVRNNVEQNKITSKIFSHNMKQALQYDVVKSYLVDYHFPNLAIGDKFFIYLIRKGEYRLLYFLFNIALLIRRFFKNLMGEGDYLIQTFVRKMNIAIIIACGSGNRMGQDIPK